MLDMSKPAKLNVLQSVPIYKTWDTDLNPQASELHVSP